MGFYGGLMGSSWIYPVNVYKNYGKIHRFFMGNSTINGHVQ